MTVTDTEPPASRRQSSIWQPSEQALKTAHSVVTEIDIPIHIARYVTVKAEKREPCRDSEWLKWVLADEAKAKMELRRLSAEATRARRWYDVAD